MHRAVWTVVLTLVLLIGAVSTPSAQTNSQSDALLQEQGLSWIDVQARLNDAGYDAGPADGFPGNLTRSALARFQRDNGLVASGQIDQLTIGALQNVASAGGSSVICSDEGGENIRFGPSARDFDVIVRLPNGTPVDVVERVTNQSGFDYFSVTYGSGQNGFIWHESVAPSCGSATAQAVPQPSFNCAAASTPTERAICGSTTLATLDVDMAAAYLAAREASPDSQAVRQSQIAWLATRDACGSDTACLSRVMSARTVELGQFAVAPAGPVPQPTMPNTPLSNVDGPEAGILGTWRGTYNCDPYVGSEIVVNITGVEITNVRKLLGDVQIFGADGTLVSQGPHRSNVNMFSRELWLYPDKSSGSSVLGSSYNRLEGEMTADLATVRMQVLGAYNALCPRGVTLRRDGAIDAPTAPSGPSADLDFDLNARLSGADLDPARPCADTRTARGEAFCISAAIQRYTRTGDIRDYVAPDFVKRVLDGSGEYAHAPQNCQGYIAAITKIREHITGRDGVAFPRSNGCDDAIAVVQALGLPSPVVESCTRVQTYDELATCAEEMIFRLQDQRWKSHREELIAGWRDADGNIPGISFGLRPSQGSFNFIQTLSQGAQTCVRGNSFGSHSFAQLIARHQSFSRDPSQTNQIFTAAQRVINCDMVTRLAADLGRLPRQDYAAYSEAAAAAETYRCSDERANTQPERLDLIYGLNRVVVAECSAGAFLSNWVEQSTAGETPSSIFAAAVWEFERLDSSCRLNSRLSTHFYAPQVTLWIGDVRGTQCTSTGDGTFSCQLQPVATVASNDDALETFFQAAYSILYPLDVSLSFDRNTCEWQADQVRVIR